MRKRKEEDFTCGIGPEEVFVMVKVVAWKSGRGS